MIERAVFGCRECGARWTQPLRPLPSWLERAASACAETLEGTYVERPDHRARPEHAIALHPVDVRGLRRHEDTSRSTGCCGVGFRPGKPNLRCAGCGHEAAYELTDGDHVPHAIFVGGAPLETFACDEPDAATLRERFAARGPGDDAGEDPAYDALLARWQVDPERVWDDDQPRAERFVALEDFGVRVAGRSVRLGLDGLWVRPAWPAAERDRVLALGAPPRGRDDVPVYGWADVPLPGAAPDRHEWHQWSIGGEVCVLWRRSRVGSPAPEPAVAWRLPLAQWERAWRAALDR